MVMNRSRILNFIMWLPILYLFLMACQVYVLIYCNSQLSEFSNRVEWDTKSLSRIDKLESKIEFLFKSNWLFFNVSKRQIEQDIYQVKNVHGLALLHNRNSNLEMPLKYLLESINLNSKVTFSYEYLDFRLVCELLQKNDAPIEKLVRHLNELRIKYNDGTMVQNVIQYLDSINSINPKGDISMICI